MEQFEESTENFTESKEGKLPGRVYYVESPQDRTVLLALDVAVEGDTIRWFDTSKERVMRCTNFSDSDPAHVTFERSQEEGGGTYSFIPLTLEIYKSKVKDEVISPKEFSDEDSMLKAFEETRKNAW